MSKTRESKTRGEGGGAYEQQANGYPPTDGERERERRERREIEREREEEQVPDGEGPGISTDRWPLDWRWRLRPCGPIFNPSNRPV